MRELFFDLIQEGATNYLSSEISKKSGDIRVAFDAMKTALTKLFKKVKNIPDCDFEDFGKLNEKI
jgi:hypothetical protein